MNQGWIYGGIVAAGIVLAVVAYQAQQQVLQIFSANQQLSQAAVLETLKSHLSEQARRLPQTPNQVKAQWLTSTQHYYAYYQGQQIYPVRFNGIDSQTLSHLWSAFESANTQGLSSGAVSRLKGLARIKAALASQQPEQVTYAARAYFDAAAHYRVSAIEETVATLTFLQLGSESRWQRDLVGQLLLLAPKRSNL